MPSDLLGAGPLQQRFSFGFFSIDSGFMLLSLRSFLFPPFPSSSLRVTRICYSVSLKPFPLLAWGPCPTFPSCSTAPLWPFSRTSCPPSSWSSPLPSKRALCSQGGPLTSAPGFLVAPSWSTHPWTPAPPLTPAKASTLLLLPGQLPPHSSLTARLLTTGPPVTHLSLLPAVDQS